MTNVDEHLLTAAKLAETVRGDMDAPADLHDHTGLVADDQDRTTMSFLARCLQEDDHDLDAARFEDTALGREVTQKFATDRATNAVSDGESTVMSHLVGVTDPDLSGEALALHARLDELLENNDAPAFVLGAGNPNTGKTNTMSLLAELRSCRFDDYLILSNVRSWEYTDVVVTSAHDLAVSLLEHRDVPKFVLVDESSTHFDARTFRREVATQWTPLAKRFAKIGVDVVGNIGHTGKDLHPELKRLATLVFWKLEPAAVEFYREWPPEADMPVDQLFGGVVEDLQETSAEYRPDDAAPWSWDLQPELFTNDLGWDELLKELRARGPADD